MNDPRIRDVLDTVRIRLDPALLMRRLGFTPDPWQVETLRASEERVLLLRSRQSGNSTTTATLGFHAALYEDRALELLLTPSQRPSSELFRKVVEFDHALGEPVPALQESTTTLLLANASRGGPG